LISIGCARFPTQPDPLRAVIGGQPDLTAVVDIGLVRPPAQTRPADLQIPSDLGRRLLRQPGRPHSATPELRPHQITP
jgi:hypothetical protein